MKKLIIGKSESGIKLIKYLKNIFKEMPGNLLHKLLRKKYFKINGVVASGNETLNSGDEISVFLGDETFEKFLYSGTIKEHDKELHGHLAKKDDDIDGGYSIDKIKEHIVYEDDNLIVFNKWAGLLSQDDGSGNESVNSVLNKYLTSDLNTKEEKKSGDNSFVSNAYNYKPSVVNRLDRNTEGLIIFAKTYVFAREISKMISENKIEKRYETIVNGHLSKDEGQLINLYKKDENKNIAIIKDIDDSRDEVDDGFTKVELNYKVIEKYDDASLVEVELITGKSHQIRAQFAHIGHPIICDKKYMDKSLYDSDVKTYKSKYQKLVCYKICFPEFDNDNLKYLSNKSFELVGADIIRP